MTWIKLEDNIYTHDRALRAGPEAMWLWVAGMCWCSQHLTDGKIPESVLPLLVPDGDGCSLAVRLVDVGLWRRVRDGFAVKNYRKFQRTAAEVEVERAAARERMRRVRANKKRTGSEVRQQSREDKRQIPPSPPRGVGSALAYCATCGLPANAAPGVPACVCESNVIELARGGVAS